MPLLNDDLSVWEIGFRWAGYDPDRWWWRIPLPVPDLHIHDLRHTVGMRLREAEVREETIADILWHTRPGMTAHYSVAQVAELVEALNRITDERHRTNRSLAMIAREALQGRKSPKVPTQMKNG